MPRGIGKRLLCDAIQVARARLIERELRPHLGAEVHFETVQIAAARREIAQRKRQAAGVGAHGEQAARERAGGLDRLVDEADDFIDVVDGRSGLRRWIRVARPRSISATPVSS